MTKAVAAALFLLTSAAPVWAGDALTQSLEHPASNGTVAEKEEPSPLPPPAPRTITDKEARKRITYDGRPSKAARRRAKPVPAVSATPTPR